jgi:chain length determinant protein (polysaccharide antigen chain regulator)
VHQERLENNPELNMIQLLVLFYQKKLWLVLTTLLGLIIGLSVIFLSKPTYEASIKLIAANEGDIAAFNLGRYGDKSPLKPISIQDVYFTFNNQLFSDALKKTFFNQFYLPSLPKRLKETESKNKIYTSFSKNFAIVEAPKAGSDRFPKFIVAIRGNNAEQVAIWLKQFIDLVRARTLAQVANDIKQQNVVMIYNLQDQIDRVRETAKEKRQDRIAQLKERIQVAQLAGKNSTAHSDSLLLHAQLKKLSGRKSDDAFIPTLPDLQAQLGFYKALTVNFDSVAVFHLDGTIDTPDSPIAPKKKLIMMVSLVLGFMFGAFGILFQIAWYKNKLHCH